MRPSLRLGRILGIEIGLHYSWFLIAALIILSLANHFTTTNPLWSPPLTWAVASVTALLFFASILAHELSHAAVAQSRGTRAQSITLFAFGGIANMEDEPADARSEFWTSIIGPIASAVIGVAAIALASVAQASAPPEAPDSPLSASLAWLGYINIGLAVFNMIPAFPLDGGRVLRAVFWWSTGSIVRATEMAGAAGRVLAGLLIVLGVFRFVTIGDLGGLWIVLIAWFLADAAAASRSNGRLPAMLSQVQAGDLMTTDCPTVNSELDLRTFVEDYILRTGRRCFVVQNGDLEFGLVTVHDLAKIDRQRWPFTSVSRIAHPLERLRFVSPDTPATTALRLMVDEDINQLAVLAEGKLRGVLSREHILRFLRTQAQLKAA